MNIKGKDICQISDMLMPYLVTHSNGIDKEKLESCLFSESYRLDYSEIEHLIPESYRKFFNGGEWFNGTSGIIEVGGEEKVLMLLANDDYSEALIFSVQEADEKGGIKNSIIADFMESMSFHQTARKEG